LNSSLGDALSAASVLNRRTGANIKLEGNIV
jgi:hypothetical protein